MVWARLIILAALAGLLAACAPSPTPGDPAEELINELMCPALRGRVSLASSETPDAAWIRGFIRAKISEGWSKQRVVDTLVRQYGEVILPAPKKEGFSLTAWLAPLATIVGGVAVVGGLLTAWLRRRIRLDAKLTAELENDIDEDELRRYEAQMERELARFEH